MLRDDINKTFLLGMNVSLLEFQYHSRHYCNVLEFVFFLIEKVMI